MALPIRVGLFGGSLAALLFGATVAIGQAQAQRATFTIPTPSSESESTGSGGDAAAPEPMTPMQRAMTMRGVDVVWAFESGGSWTVNADGTARARIAGGHALVELEQDDWRFPITIAGPLLAQSGDVHHIPFSQVRGEYHPRSGIGSPAPNFLDQSDYSGPVLQTDTGSLRVDLSDGGFAMQFQAHAIECRYWRPGDTAQEPCRSSLAGAGIPTGRAAFVSGWVCAVEQWERNPESCDPPLGIDLVTPQPDRENVNYEDPQIAVVFSQPIELASLAQNFEIHSRNAAGGRLDVTGEWEQIGHSRYGFEPTGGFELRSGIKFRAEITGGPDGVQARDTGKFLEDDLTWDFSTLLNMSEQWDSDEEQLRLHNFQVVRDGLLTANKPTLARLYLDWDLHNDIHEDWQPESYSMSTVLTPRPVRASAQRGRPAGPEGPIRIWRDENFDDEDRRHARHTVNFFGWRPPSGGGGTQRLEISPYQPWPRPLEDAREAVERDFEVWAHDPRNLLLHYTFAEVGAWANGIPAETRALASAIIRETARQVPSFFPHRQARSVPINTIQPLRQSRTAQRLQYDAEGNRIESAFDRQDVFDQIEPTSEMACQFLRGIMPRGGDYADQTSGAATYLLNAFNEKAAMLRAYTQPGDVVVVFVPEDFFTGGTVGVALGMSVYNIQTNFGFPDMRAYLSVLPSGEGLDLSFDEFVQIHLHELGHEFGLEHVPGNAQTVCPETANTVAAGALQGRMIDPIEGWRMAPSGLDGWNKSLEEGNAESSDTLVSMMWPYAMPTGLMGILDSNYAIMQRSAAEGPAVIWQSQATPPAFGPLRTAGDIRADRLRGPMPVADRLAGNSTVADSSQLWSAGPRLASATGDIGAGLALSAANGEPSDRLIITGSIAPDRSGLTLSPPVLGTDTWPVPSPGPLRAELIDAGGAVIATAPAGYLTADTGVDWQHFRVSLPVDDRAVALVIREGPETRARLDVSGPPPRFTAVEVFPTGPDDPQLVLDWTVDGAAEYVDISYRPSNTSPWQVLAPGVDARLETFSLPMDGLAAGTAPTLRLVVHDGLRIDQHLIAVTPAMVPQRFYVSPPESASWAEGQPVMIRVEGVIPAEDLAEAIVVFDAADNFVEWSVHHNPATSTFSILPASINDAEPPFRLDLDPQLAADWNLHLSGQTSWPE